MRTTLTLDDDVAGKLQQLAKRSGASFKETVNATLRRGLAAQERRAVRPPAFRVDPFNSPMRPGVDPLRLNQLLDQLDADAFAATEPGTGHGPA